MEVEVVMNTLDPEDTVIKYPDGTWTPVPPGVVVVIEPDITVTLPPDTVVVTDPVPGGDDPTTDNPTPIIVVPPIIPGTGPGTGPGTPGTGDDGDGTGGDGTGGGGTGGTGPGVPGGGTGGGTGGDGTGGDGNGGNGGSGGGGETITGGNSYVVTLPGVFTTPKPEYIRPSGDYPTSSSGSYPVILYLCEIFIDESGINYSPGDKVTIEPDIGAVAEPKFDARGRVTSIKVTESGEGFTEYPTLYIQSETGYNAVLRPKLCIDRVGNDKLKEPTFQDKVITVIDCVGKV